MRPTNKAARLDAVRQIVRQGIVTSQGELARLLSLQDIVVTQATLSRDLDELHAAKMRYPDGAIGYWIPDSGDQSLLEVASLAMTNAADSSKTDQYLSRVLTGLITSVKQAKNLLVVRTPSGAAQYAASALDRQPIVGVLGTIAGDDTVLVITSDDEEAAERAQWLINITSGESSAKAQHKQENGAKAAAK
ncbi:arginine repressor [Bombiscardovia apis]|uniref:Arginine repressor n=1 Tax=Bombiscardovia apis TaxID=2932182 RepID=A0ABN6SJH5_9BIFI|nr:arginine repressor [Bombiscardovia apis]BDR54875.1 arginine repressor [Bombiscardovia apis]